MTSVTSAAACLPWVLRIIEEAADSNPIDGVVVACFSAHPLVPMLRELTSIPIVGIMEAGLLLGSQLGGTLGIVTTDKRWEPLLEHEIRGELGLDGRCRAGVISSGLTVLELESAPAQVVHSALVTSAQRLVQDRGADVILLGCAGMIGLDRAVREAVGEDVTVLDPVRCGVEMCLSLTRMHVRTAKRGRYEQATMG